MKTGHIQMICLLYACVLFLPVVAIAGELRDYTLPSERGYSRDDIMQMRQMPIDRRETPAVAPLSETDRQFADDLRKAASNMSKEQVNALKESYQQKLSSAQRNGDRYSEAFYNRLLEILSSCPGGNQP